MIIKYFEFEKSIEDIDSKIEILENKNNDSDIDLVKEYYNYSTSKAKTALELLSDDELEYIRKRSFKGGVS